MNIITLNNAVRNFNYTGKNPATILAEKLAEDALDDREDYTIFGDWVSKWSIISRAYEGAVRLLATALANAVRATIEFDSQYRNYDYLCDAMKEAKKQFNITNDDIPYGIMRYIALMGMSSTMDGLGAYVAWSQEVDGNYDEDGYFGDKMDMVVYAYILKFIGDENVNIYLEGDSLVAEAFRLMYDEDKPLNEVMHYVINELKKGEAHEALNLFVKAQQFEREFNELVIGSVFNHYVAYDKELTKNWRGHGVDEFYSGRRLDEVLKGSVYEGWASNLEFVQEELEKHVKMMVRALRDVVKRCDK